MRRFFFRVLLALTLVLASLAAPQAHDVPGQVLVQVQMKAEGQRLRLLIRVPLVAMQDMDFPTRGPDYLNIPDADASLRQAVDTQVASGITAFENDIRLGNQQVVAVMASLPSNRAFVTFDQALAHVLGPRLPDGTEIVWQQVMLDVLIEYPIQSDRSNFSIEPALARLGQRTQTIVHYVRADGTVRAFDVRGNPGVLLLDPSWGQAAFRFGGLGVRHMFGGIEHLLFLACLVIPMRRLRPLVASVTSFAIANTVTLLAGTFGFVPAALWFPPLIDVLIALSIALLAFENALGVPPKRRWLVAFAFGLAHGFAFSFALRETLQFAGGHGLVSILAFNVGIEIGQLLIVVGLVALTTLLFRVVLPLRAGTILLSGLVAHTAWHWLLARGGQLSLYDINLTLPTLDPPFLAGAMRWGMLMLMVLTLVWLMSMVFPKMERSGES